MNLYKKTSILSVLLLTPFIITLNAQQAVNIGGGSGEGGGGRPGGGPAPTIQPIDGSSGGGTSATVPVSIAPVFPRIILDRLEVAAVKTDIGTENWITLYGTFPAAPTGVTISQSGEWVSFSQNWSIENAVKFPVDASLPPGTYQVSISQGVESNKQPLSFSITETGEVVPVPIVGGKTLIQPNNDLRPIIDSFDPKLIAGRRSLITGRRFNPPLMVRIEGNSGDVAWARRVVPTSEGTIEFVTPSTHFGSLVLVVDNGQGTYRVSVTVAPPPSPRPNVTRLYFSPMQGGGIIGLVSHDKPLTANSIIILAQQGAGGNEENDTREIKDIIVLFPPFPPDPHWEEEIQEVEAKGIKILRPITLYGDGITAFLVPEPFASKGVDWLNKQETDSQGNARWVNIWAEVEMH
ncbi:MAG: hypothetical protein Q7S86_00390 [bacterium]|nr:hypothetical protein [bacterium]